MVGQCHALAALPAGKRPLFHCTGDWVCPRAGLAWEKNVALTVIRYLDHPHVRDGIVHQVDIYHLRKSAVVELTY